MNLDMDKVKSQALRFGRLTVTTALGSWLALGEPLDKAALLGVAVGAVEVAVRQVWPTIKVPTVPPPLPEKPAENA